MGYSHATDCRVLLISEMVKWCIGNPRHLGENNEKNVLLSLCYEHLFLFSAHEGWKPAHSSCCKYYKRRDNLSATVLAVTDIIKLYGQNFDITTGNYHHQSGCAIALESVNLSERARDTLIPDSVIREPGQYHEEDFV